ncbi:MAG: PAS domain S-box protein [Spirochaetes bacterium]|nr:PAS domain S-box protein [Spirochaetota bacterium]MBU0956061.1 PAS domain S-box protein [Spirochaetota bacterium]
MGATRAKPSPRTIRVLIATEQGADRQGLKTVLPAASFPSVFVDTLGQLEAAIHDIDIIIADTAFSHGSLSDWLMLWPVPALLLASEDDDPDRLAELTSDESSAFLLRDKAGLWLQYIPAMLRKLLAIRESVNRQNIHVLRAENSYMTLMRLIPDIVYVLDGDGNFSYINDAIRQLGFAPEELIGRHFSMIIHPEDQDEISRHHVLQRYHGITTGPEAAPKLFDERRSGERMTRNLEVRLMQKGLAEWTRANVSAWGEVSANGVYLPDLGRDRCGTIGIIHDVSARRMAEHDLQMKLDTYSVMLKEIHHRVKNNLQIVSSLLSLQGGGLEDDAAAIFESCQTQVQAMALVHEQVYRGSSLQNVQAAAYLARLIEYLSLVYNTDERGISFSVEAGELTLPLAKAIPLSLIVTELITNSCKHAFVDGREGHISVQLQESKTEYQLTVRDNGPGFRDLASHATAIPAAHADYGLNSHRSIGMDIITALSAQLQAEISRSNDSGALTRLLIPKVTGTDSGLAAG